LKGLVKIGLLVGLGSGSVSVVRLLGFGCSVSVLGFASAVAILEICSAQFALVRFVLARFANGKIFEYIYYLVLPVKM